MNYINPRLEGIRLLKKMFAIPEGYSNGTIEQIVDNIIKAAIFEMKATAEISSVDECKTDERLKQRAERIKKLEAALEGIRDCDWVIMPHAPMDAVRTIAREALEE